MGTGKKVLQVVRQRQAQVAQMLPVRPPEALIEIERSPSPLALPPRESLDRRSVETYSVATETEPPSPPETSLLPPPPPAVPAPPPAPAPVVTSEPERVSSAALPVAPAASATPRAMEDVQLTFVGDDCGILEDDDEVEDLKLPSPKMSFSGRRSPIVGPTDAFQQQASWDAAELARSLHNDSIHSSVYSPGVKNESRVAFEDMERPNSDMALSSSVESSALPRPGSKKWKPSSWKPSVATFDNLRFSDQKAAEECFGVIPVSQLAEFVL